MQEKELPIIKNIDELATNPLRQDALDILEAGYESILTDKIISQSVSLDENILKIKDQKYDLKKYKNIFLIAAGKCSNESAHIFEEVLGDKITDGVVLDLESFNFKKIKSKIGTHPFPSEQNINATKSIIKILEKSKKDDLIISLISGGGSSLLCSTSEGIGCDFLKELSDELIKKGATIGEINIIRKHLSQIKGGHFARLAYPSKVVSVIFSDIPGDDISLVASGPTVLDKTTKQDAKMVLESYSIDDLEGKLTQAISFLTETPKDEKYFENVDNILLVTNMIALKAMEKKAEDLGYETVIELSNIQGEAKGLINKLVAESYLPKSCHIWGGETTVQVLGDGKGGRNQEFVLASLGNLPKDVLVLAAASDGQDNTDVAGALVDYEVLKEISDKEIDWREYLENNDSYNFFKKIKTQIKTGRTGINVADFYLILKK
ncbi:MAG: DUF4147 domain-containing protein [Candidatus Pacebacteria bacterium]|nr:DUF4147 domain-containing protein [Candidatus Paceibacterota bacterium]